MKKYRVLWQDAVDTSLDDVATELWADNEAHAWMLLTQERELLGVLSEGDRVVAALVRNPRMVNGSVSRITIQLIGDEDELVILDK